RINVRQKYIFLIISLLLVIISACQSDETEENEQSIIEPEKSVATDEEPEIRPEPVEIEWTDYSEEIDLNLDAPLNQVNTSFLLEGTIGHYDQLLEEYVWVIVRKSENIEEINNRQIEYYLPIEHGKFSQNINLPNGEGDYHVTVR